MKKLLIMLMVVAMASFLFVGCIPVTPPVDPDEPVDPVLPPSTTPVIEEIRDVDDEVDIINLYSSDTQYMNKTEIANGILVKGSAPKYSEVNVYVDDEVVGTGTAYGVSETFTVFVAEDNLGDDGEKTIYATATELGFAESDPSNEYEFTLDTVALEIVSVYAKIEGEEVVEGIVTVTFDGAVKKTIAETEGNWSVNFSGAWASDYELVGDAELISPKVVELEINAVGSPGDDFETGDAIRVACENVEDLAGNVIVKSFEYCWLELEE